LNISGSRITGKIRRRFLEATLSQEIAYFDSKENGSISVQTTTNGNLIQLGISERLGLTIEACATFVAAFIVAFISQWKLTLITLSIVPVILTVVIITVGLDAAIENRVLDIYGQAGILAEDVISSIRNVQAFWMGPKLLKKYDTYLKKAYRQGLKKNPVYGVLFSVEYFMVFVGFALAFWRGVHMYADGELPGPGDILV
jgi:ATP-binding cassette subfamily B (MDR/TAP) protein 1